MAEKLTVGALLQRNKEYAAAHEPLPTNRELAAKGFQVPPKTQTLVISCRDPRNVPEKYLKLQTEDAVVVMRNVCGHVTAIMNDILAADVAMTFEKILIIHHTDCGATYFKDADIREGLKTQFPDRIAEVEAMSFRAINDIEQSVRDDIAMLKAHLLVRNELKEHLLGFNYDLKTGLLTAVVD